MKYILIFLFLVQGFSSLAQVQSATRRIRITGIPKINAETGEKFSEKEFIQFIQQHPGLVPKEKIDKYGNVEAMIFDPHKTGKVSYRDPALRVKPGDDFLPFVMKTTTGDVLDSEKLKGKKILLHCQISLKTKALFVEKAFNEVVQLTKEYKNPEELLLVIWTEDFANDLKDFTSENAPFYIVADARNFYERYYVTSFPCNILIDKQGKLVSYFDNIDFEKLKTTLLR